MGTLNFQELISAFIVLFAVIDIIGAVPIILDLKQKGRAVNAVQATLIAAALLLGFFFAGDMMLPRNGPKHPYNGFTQNN